MNRKMLKWLSLALVIVVLASSFAIVAAQEEETEVEPIEMPEVDPLNVEGDIITAGSSTVYPLSVAMAELFEEEGYLDVLTIDSIGSGAGFERFCESAETDIANASRAIKDSEVETCIANGRTPVEFRVGTDALAIAVSLENDYVDNLTIEQLGQIFAGEFTTWNEVNADWPADPIHLFSPGTDSGTFDFFVEEVMEPYAEGMGVEEDAVGDAAMEAILNVEGAQFSENDNVLVEGIAGDKGAIGYFGYAYYLENDDVIRIVNIEGVEPNEETAENGEYPLARPLFIYSAPSIMAEKPQVADFIAFYLANVNDIITEVGYFPASTDALNTARCNWFAAVEMDMEVEECGPYLEMHMDEEG